MQYAVGNGIEGRQFVFVSPNKRHDGVLTLKYGHKILTQVCFVSQIGAMWRVAEHVAGQGNTVRFLLKLASVGFG